MTIHYNYIGGNEPGGSTGNEPGGSTGSEPGGTTGNTQNNNPGGNTGTAPSDPPEEDPEDTLPAAGTRLTDKKAVYTVIKPGSTVAFVKAVDKKAASVSIPASVTFGGVTYKVASIAERALANQKNLKSLIIGKNVERIGSKAFYGCKNLKKITIRSTELTKKSVGSKAFSGIYKKATIKVPKSKLATYKKMLKAKGIGSRVKVVK